MAPKSNLRCAVISMGHLFMNAFAVWNLMSWAVYHPCVRIFQSEMSRILSSASSMKMTSVKGVIMALLNARCFVTVAMFPWWTSSWIGKNKLVLPLFAAATRHGTLSMFFFAL